MSKLNKIRKAVVATGLTVSTTVWLFSAALLVPSVALAYANGDLLKDASSANIYVINNGVKVWVRSAAVFEGCGYTWASIKTVSDLTSVSTADLIKNASNPDVYRLEKNFKRKLASIEIFNSYTLDWNKVATVCNNVLDSYSIAPLIQQTGTADIYWVKDDTLKHKMTSWESFTEHGFNIADVIGINAMEMGSYTAGDAVYATPVVPPVTGGLTVALASDNPGGTYIPKGAANVTYLKFNLANGTASAATVDSIVVTRKDVGAAADFTNVYLYEGDNRLTSGRTISSQTQQATFPNLNLSVAANSTKTLSVVAEMSSTATAADVNYLEISQKADISTTATIDGSFPIKGNPMIISAQSVGLVTIAASGTPASPYVGDKGAEVARFQLTASSAEDIEVRRIILTNGGSTASANLTNIKLYRGTDVVAEAASMTGDRASLVLTTPYLIVKGQNKIFSVTADVTGRPSETIILYIDYTTDVYATGKTYGGGVRVTNSFASSNAATLTLLGGVVTVSFDGPVAANVKTTANDVHMLDFGITAAKNVEVRSTKVYICWDTGGNGTYNDLTTNALSEINDVKIIERTTGGVVAGGTDGSGFSIETSTSGACPNSTLAAYKTWTDYYDVNEATTRNLAVSLDLAVSSYLTAADKIKVVLDDYADANDVKYRDVNNYVATADVVPSTNIVGNEMTIASASLTAAAAATPVSNTYVKNASANALGIIWTAGEAKGVKLTALTLTAYVHSTSATTNLKKSTDGTVTSQTLIAEVSLYNDDGTLISGPKSVVSGLATFSGLNWPVAAGSSKRMIIKVKIGSNTPQQGAADYAAFDISATTHASLEDDDGNSVTFSSTGINGTLTTVTTANDTMNSPKVVLTISSGGALYVTPASDTPVANLVIMGTAGSVTTKTTGAVLMSKFQVAATNVEDFMVKTITLNNASSTPGNYDDNINSVVIEYPKDAAGTLETKYTSLATGEAKFTECNFFVPKNGTAYLNVYAHMSTLSEGADSGDLPALSWVRNLTSANEFKAIGQGSGTTYVDTSASMFFDGTAGTGVDEAVAGSAMTIRQTKPSFAAVTTQGTLTEGVQTLFEFAITADAKYDVYVKKLRFDVLVTDAATSSALTVGGSNWGLYNKTLDPSFALNLAAAADAFSNNSATSSPSYTNNASAQALLVEPNSEVTISKGTTYTFALRTNVASVSTVTTEIDRVGIRLTSEADTNIRTGALTYGDADLLKIAATAVSYAWSDGSAGAASHSATIGSSSSDWTNGYQITILPSDYRYLKSNL